LVEEKPTMLNRLYNMYIYSFIYGRANVAAVTTEFRSLFDSSAKYNIGLFEL